MVASTPSGTTSVATVDGNQQLATTYDDSRWNYVAVTQLRSAASSTDKALDTCKARCKPSRRSHGKKTEGFHRRGLSLSLADLLAAGSMEPT